MPYQAKPKDKKAYGAKLVKLIQEHKTIMLISVNNVGSNQIQQVRIKLRNQAEIMMGKNTTIRKVLRDFIAKNPEHPVAGLLEHINGNIGFVFTNGDIAKIRETIVSNQVPAPARVGSLAPADVYVEPGPTGCDPGQTSWFQALNIPTKINKGQIEMIARVHLIKLGDKVGESEAALLDKLNIRPFSYSIKAVTVYQEGDIFSADVLDITEDDMQRKFIEGARTVAALGMMLNYPTKAQVTHGLNNALKALIAISMGTDFKFPKAQEFEDFLANPSNFVSAPAAGGAAAVVEEEEEEEEEEDVGGAGDLFGGDDEDDW